MKYLAVMQYEKTAAKATGHYSHFGPEERKAGSNS